jgi:hypothetical protein
MLPGGATGSPRLPAGLFASDAEGGAYRGHADVGEVLSTAGRVKDGDAWVREWCATAERLRIPYRDTTLPGSFFRAPGAGPGERRPLVVLDNGSDGPTPAMGLFGGWAALERGYHAMTFDFRHDREAVLTPVADAMLARPDVDPGRVAVIGVSQAGYWVPRALAFEHRLVAAVADPEASCAPSCGTRPSGTASTRRWAGPSGSPGRPGRPCTSAASPTAWPATRASTSTRR